MKIAKVASSGDNKQQGAPYERSAQSGKVEVTLNGGLEKAVPEEGEHVKGAVVIKEGYGRREPARFMRVRLEDVGAGEKMI